MSAQYDRAKEELTAGTRYEEYRPLVPFLGMMILGILADRFFLESSGIRDFDLRDRLGMVRASRSVSYCGVCVPETETRPSEK